MANSPVTDGIRPRVRSERTTDPEEERDAPQRRTYIQQPRQNQRPGGGRYANSPSGQRDLAAQKEGEQGKSEASAIDKMGLYSVASFLDAGCLLFTLCNFIIPLLGSVLAIIFVGIPGNLIMYSMFKKRRLLESKKNRNIFIVIALTKMLPFIGGYWAFTTGTKLMLNVKRIEKKLGMSEGDNK